MRRGAGVAAAVPANAGALGAPSAHPLCYSLSVYDGSFNCDQCERDRNGPAYHCDFCRFDICIACALDVVLTIQGQPAVRHHHQHHSTRRLCSHMPQPAVSDLASLELCLQGHSHPLRHPQIHVRLFATAAL